MMILFMELELLRNAHEKPLSVNELNEKMQIWYLYLYIIYVQIINGSETSIYSVEERVFNIKLNNLNIHFYFYTSYITLFYFKFYCKQIIFVSISIGLLYGYTLKAFLYKKYSVIFSTTTVNTWMILNMAGS